MPSTGPRPRVRRLERRRDVEALGAALRWRRWTSRADGPALEVGGDVRRDAVRALAKMDDAAAHRELVTALDDPDEGVRMLAVRALCDGGDAPRDFAAAIARWPPGRFAGAYAQAVDDLLRRDAEAAVRAFVAGALPVDDRLHARDEETIVALVAACEQPGAVWEAIVDDALAAPLDSARTADVVRLAAPHAGGRLLELLGSDEHRLAAVAALGFARRVEALERLVSFEGSDDPAIRRELAVALGRIKHPSSITVLLRLALDDEYAVRDAAMTALDGLGTIAVAGTILAAQSEQLGGNGNLVRDELPETAAPPSTPVVHRRGGLVDRMLRAAGRAAQ